jgi:hypothetical protein
MFALNTLVAAADAVCPKAAGCADKLSTIHDKLASLPNHGLYIMWFLSIATTMLMVVVFIRQKKIAQNQIQLAKLMEQLIEKK